MLDTRSVFPGECHNHFMSHVIRVIWKGQSRGPLNIREFNDLISHGGQLMRGILIYLTTAVLLLFSFVQC